MKEKRREGPVLLVDTGDTLYPMHAREASEPLQKNAGIILRALGTMGYDALVVGPQDLVAGADVLKAKAAEMKVPLLAANLVDADGRPVFEPSRVVEIGGIRMGLIGLGTSHLSPPAAQVYARAKVTGTPAAAAARKAADDLRGRVDELIIAGHLNMAEAREVAKAVPEARLMLLGGNRRLSRTADRLEQTLAYEAGSRGQYLLHLALTLDGEGPLADLSRRASAEQLLEGHRGRIANLERRLETAGPQKPVLDRQLQQARQQLAQAEQDVAAIESGGGQVVAAATALDGKIAVDPEVAAFSGATAAPAEHGAAAQKVVPAVRKLGAIPGLESRGGRDPATPDRRKGAVQRLDRKGKLPVNLGGASGGLRMRLPGGGAGAKPVKGGAPAPAGTSAPAPAETTAPVKGPAPAAPTP